MALEFVTGFIVSSLLQDLVDKIKASAADTIALAYSSNVEEELKELEATYIKALSMLDKVDGWDLVASKAHRDWVADIRRACYETEDFTESLELEILQKKGDVGLLGSYWSKWGLSSRVRDLRKKLVYLVGASDVFVKTSHGGTDERQEKEPMIVPDDESFRRKKDKDSIIRRLLCTNSSCVVMISGMFGVGKTALAQVVKNDSRIQQHFDHTLWVSVAGDFSLMKVLCSMILDLQPEQEQIKEGNLVTSHPSTEQRYAKMFQALCKEKKVFIVMDDLCNFVNPQDWEDFQTLLLDPSCVFGILVTTRNPKVATTVSLRSCITTDSYYLPQMSDEDCALILQKKAAPVTINKRMRCGRSISEAISVQMAEKYCKGLPLVANIIGHNLSLKQEDSLHINGVFSSRVKTHLKLSNDLWSMPEFRELIFPAFRLNYSDLSFALKNCFPYFSLFPERYAYKKDDLTRLWLAEGFIKPEVTGLQYSEYPVLEELQTYHFDKVLSQSILQIHHPFDQQPLTYRMHEFIHRYAQLIGSDMYVQLDEQFLVCSLGETNNASSSTNCLCRSHMLTSANISTRYKYFRHLSLLCHNIPTPIWKDIERYSEGLRTVLSLCDHISIGQISYTLFLKLQSLRVLNLSGTDISELPESLGKLSHLRLLDFSRTNIQEFPTSTTDLCMLQSLKADQCPLLLQLPKKMERLTHLLHLEVDIKSLSSMPCNIGKLCNLRTLPAFIVGRKDGYHITELKNMKHLQGSICLTNLEYVRDEREAKKAMLSNKPFLRRLELEWNRYSTNQLIAEKIIDGLEPHENLDELQISGYDGTQFPSWLSSPHCNLTSIHLLRCDECEILPALGQLQYLKSLYIEEMHSVEHINDQFSAAGFPSLELLKFQDMGSLEKWEGLKANQMPRLREVNITDCPKLVALPSLNFLTALVNLEISYCPALQTLPEEGLPLLLETLIIVRCDFLERRCRSVDADWDKIKGVNKVVIDFVQIPTLAGET